MKKYSLLMACMMAGVLISGCSSSQPDAGFKTDEIQKENISSNNQSQSSNDEEDLEDDIELGGVEADGQTINLSDCSENVKITQGGEYSISGSFEHTLIVDADGKNVTLTLKDASINPADGPAIYIRNAKKVILNVEGENSLKQNQNTQNPGLNAALYSKDDLEIKGSGTLNVESSVDHGIKAKDTLSIDQAVLNINAAGDGIHVNESGIFNASLKIEAQDEGVDGKTTLEIQSGSLEITSKGDCIRAQEMLTVSQGELNLVSEENEGLESKQDLVISGGNIQINASDDAINAAKRVEIKGGTILAVSVNNDSIDSNGDLIISGGNIQAYAARQPEGALDTDNTPLVISGSDLIAIGPIASYPTETGQNVLMVGGSGSIDSVSIKDDSGSIILEASDIGQYLSAGSNALMFSSDKLKTGSTVTLSVNGSEAGSIEIQEGLTTVGQIPSMGGFGGGNPTRR